MSALSILHAIDMLLNFIRLSVVVVVYMIYFRRAIKQKKKNLDFLGNRFCGLTVLCQMTADIE